MTKNEGQTLPTIADAILDRIRSKCSKFDLKGKSLRTKI